MKRFGTSFNSIWLLANAALIFVATGCQNLARAEDSDYEVGMKELFRDFSFIDLSEINPDHCDVSQVLDFSKYSSGMASIRDAWLYKDKSIEYYQRRAYRILFIVGRKWATFITQTIYVNPKFANCRFRLLISDQDKFGNDRPLVLASWRFTRELSNNTHWNVLDDHKFPELALNWKWGEEFVDRVKLEPPQ